MPSLNASLTLFLGETWELSGWLLRQLMGPAHEEDILNVVETIQGWIEDESLLDCIRIEQGPFGLRIWFRFGLGLSLGLSFRIWFGSSAA